MWLNLLGEAIVKATKPCSELLGRPIDDACSSFPRPFGPHFYLGGAVRLVGMTPKALALWLAVYFLAIAGGVIVIDRAFPGIAEYLPVGGLDIEIPSGGLKELRPVERRSLGERIDTIYALVASLVSTVLMMLPLTWVYVAARSKLGFKRNFIATLILLPIVVTPVVNLIQDSLALAFGLAALVTAVRFRVSLRDALDGIFVFAAVGVGLACGVAHVGVAYVMAVFFCYGGLLLWATGFGSNPAEDAKLARKLAKRERKLETRTTDQKPP